MKLSKFNVFLYDYNIIFNTLTGYAIKVSKEEMEKLANGEVPENLKEIIEEGFADQEFDPDKLIMKKEYLEPTLVLTYDCNFDCPYCFQKAFKNKLRVTDSVIKGFINYIDKHVNNRKIRVTYFGGEPLLELDKIKTISKELLSRYGDKYSFSIVTNTSLLFPRILDELNSLGLRYVQVTLDGPKEIHDKRRYFIGGKGSYNIIIDNLKYAQDHTNVVLRINIDFTNANYIKDLLTDLKEKKITKIRLDPHLVHDNVFNDKYWNRIMPKENEGKILTEFWETAKDLGFEIPQEVFRLGVCVAHIDEDIVVDPIGNIYPCWAFTGNPLYIKGKLKEDGTIEYLNSKLSSVVAKNIWKGKCEDCPYLPMCLGGCRFFSVLDGNGFDGISCKKSNYEEIVKLIKYFV
ncbi:radical SAM/SPASM domain-containing protein [Acidianus manzaensis]|uniref:Radical SAM/SPASM domain-containing protein n=1 Tax=Acidianus manzaensis TaxID=282676 RepID=A0A1W6K0P4_9CREN|nr:radical SAM protein [Acidianus manzaensis]ARM76079.1 radical SAM/SPASM domain-containing protein [Acidianus manzaensis]